METKETEEERAERKAMFIARNIGYFSTPKVIKELADKFEKANPCTKD